MASIRDLKVERWPLGRLRVDPRNPRAHPPAQIRRLLASIEEFGWTNPILADASGSVIAGAARLEAARARRQESVPVIVLDGLTPAQAQAYRLVDNRIPLDAEWDDALLAEALAEIAEAGLDLAVTGFNDEELTALLAATDEPGPDELTSEEVEAEAAPPPAVPVTRLGDLWELGRHRVICGDSTDARVLDRLVQGADLVFTDPPYGMGYDGGRARKRADMVFTDPPYGMAFGAGKEEGSTFKGATVKAHGEILGDDLKGDALVALVAGALTAALASSRPGAAVYVCLTWRSYGEFLEALARAGLAVAACIVWDKGSIGLGFQHYRPRHEFIFYCAPGADTHWYGGKDQGDVWDCSRGDRGGYVHPTQKPVALVRRALANSSLPGDVVLDVFGGSGSTLIACEQLRRRGRLVELDPKYCDTILRRWQDLTGGTARRHADGATFNDLVSHDPSCDGRAAGG